MIVQLSAEAERNLEEIADHIAAENPAGALRFLTQLRGKCLGLAEFPERFPLVPRFERLGVRHRVHGNYLIFYRVETDRVVVLHILHGAMDYTAILPPA